MCTEDGTRAAIACSHCARPISPPSSETAALLDMFCGLKGRTFRPRFEAIRQRPATNTVFPTSEPVPCSMIKRVMPSPSKVARRPEAPVLP